VEQRKTCTVIDAGFCLYNSLLEFVAGQTCDRVSFQLISNFIVNLLAGIATYAFYDTKPSINMEFEREEKQGVKQLTLF